MRVSNYPLEPRYRRLHTFLNLDYRILLGLGRTSSWNIEATPPSPDITALNIDEPITYRAISIKKGAIQVPAIQSYDIELEGRYYKLYDEPSLEDIRSKMMRHMYLELEINHTSLIAPSFRSLGVFYIGEVLNKENSKKHCYNTFAPDDIDPVPLYFENFNPVEVQEDVRQTFKLVIEV